MEERRAAQGVAVGVQPFRDRPRAHWATAITVLGQSGRRFRVLNIVDDVTRECLRAVADTSISGERVVRELAI